MKTLISKSLFVLAVILSAPVWIFVNTFSKIENGNQPFLSGGQLFSLIPGRTGIFFRRAYYSMTLKSCSPDCWIDFGTWLSNRQARIGKRVYIGGRCSIGMVDIGDDVLIGSNVDILSGKNQHFFEDLDRPINQQGGDFQMVFIGKDCWIGNGSVVAANVEAHCVIGAGSIVMKDIPSFSIAVGNPARVVGSRKET